MPIIRLLLLTVFTAAALHAGEGDSAPSSHLVAADSKPGDILINELRIPQSGEAKYTYYEGLGWGGSGGGYAGLQAHPKGHNFIFSIWDNKAHRAPIRAIHLGPGTKVEKFGGEGTGLKSWNFERGWQTDVWHTLVARCWPAGDETLYGFWARDGANGHWTHFVTMATAVAGGSFRGGNDSFLEDWVSSGSHARCVHLRGGWKRHLDGRWHPADQATYSVNKIDLEPGRRSFNFRSSWDGGVGSDATGSFYYMKAGGDTKPTTTNPAKFTLPALGTAPAFPPLVIDSLVAESATDGVTVRWQVAAAGLPQFAWTVELLPAGGGEPVRATAVEAHTRSAHLPAVQGSGWTVRLRLTDLLDGTTEKSIPIAN